MKVTPAPNCCGIFHNEPFSTENVEKKTEKPEHCSFQHTIKAASSCHDAIAALSNVCQSSESETYPRTWPSPSCWALFAIDNHDRLALINGANESHVSVRTVNVQNVYGWSEMSRVRSNYATCSGRTISSSSLIKCLRSSKQRSRISPRFSLRGTCSCFSKLGSLATSIFTTIPNVSQS